MNIGLISPFRNKVTTYYSNNQDLQNFFNTNKNVPGFFHPNLALLTLASLTPEKYEIKLITTIDNKQYPLFGRILYKKIVARIIGIIIVPTFTANIVFILINMGILIKLVESVPRVNNVSTRLSIKQDFKNSLILGRK